MPVAVEQELEAYRAGDIDGARTGLRRLVDTDASPDAYRALAGLELAEGNEADARAMLSVLAAGDDLLSGPQAAVVLTMLDDPVVAGPVLHGLAKEMTGDLDAAREVYVTTARNDPARAALANAFLGGLLLKTEPDAEEALEPLMDAAQSDDRLAFSYACFLAGPLLLDLEGVELAGSAVWRAADANGHPVVLPWAALLLSEMFAAAGDLNRAQAAFELAVKVGHPGLAPRCYAGLFQVLARQGDRAALRGLYRRAIEGGRADLVPGYACWMLGEESVLADDLPGARAVLERVPESDEGFGAAAVAVRCTINGAHDAVRAALGRLRVSNTDGHRQASQLCFQVALRLEAHSGTDAYSSALETLTKSGDSDSAARAFFLLGKLCNATGDRAGALEAWRKGATTDHPVLARSSATGLAVLLTVHGDRTGARAAIGQGMDYPFALTVAEDLREAGDVDAATVAFNLVMEGDDPVAAGRAAYSVGRIRDDRGDLRGAADAFRRAADSGDDTDAAQASYHLADVCRRLGDPHGAADAVVAEHRHATATGSAELIANAACRLGDLRRERGDLAAARQAYEQVVQHGAGPAVSWGILGLGIVAQESGDTESARRNLLRVVDVTDSRTGVVAAMMLGLMAKEERDLPQARRWYQRAIDSGDPHEVPLALAHLGELCHWLGNRDDARAYYERVLDSTEQPDLIAEAAFRLGEMAAQAGDPAKAAKLLTIASDTGDPDFSQQATGMLADLKTNRYM